MTHDGLTIDELLHYGTLNQVEGLSPEIAERFEQHLDTTKADINQDMADEIEGLKETIEEVRSAVG